MAGFVIVAGDVIEGFRFIGPFRSEDEACDYGSANQDGLGNLEWVVAPLDSLNEVAMKGEAANDR